MQAQEDAKDVSEIIQTRIMGIVSFTILVWDHIITFDDEVDYIWKRSKGRFGYLFLLNRYLMPLGFIVNLVAYNLQKWTIERCTHYVRYEGSMTIIGIEVVALMMMLRVRALYKDSRRYPLIIGLIAFIFVVETAVGAWLLAHGIAVTHTSGVHSCSMIFGGISPKIATASAWLPLLYETVVLLLILYSTVPALRRNLKEAGQVTQTVTQTIFHDGLLYYSLICSVTLVLTVMIAAAPPGIRNITAQLELLLTVTMMSRITLNLRKQGYQGSTSHRSDSAGELTFSRDRPFSDATTRTRSRSFTPSDYLTAGANIGVNFTRPAPLRRLSTICSERSSDIGKQTPGSGGSPVSISASMREMVWNITQLHQLEVEASQAGTPIKRDEETL
jgi:hypothetical protein